MRDFISKKIRGIAPSGIRKYFDIVSEMKDAISLGVGEPDFGTPWEISEAGIRSVQKGFTHYTSNKGMPKLREAISRYLSSRYKVHYDKEEIVVTVGASEAIDITLRAVCDPGDEVLIPTRRASVWREAGRGAWGAKKAMVLSLRRKCFKAR